MLFWVSCFPLLCYWCTDSLDIFKYILLILYTHTGNLTTQVTIMQSQAPTNGGGLRGYGSHKSNGKTQLFGQHNKQPSKENLLQKHQGPSSPLLGITEETQVNQESRNGTTEHDVMVSSNIVAKVIVSIISKILNLFSSNKFEKHLV